jgi:hypothetical protein
LTPKPEFCTVAVNKTIPPVATLVTGADTLTVGGGGGVIMRLADPEMAEFDCSSALTITELGLGTADGAV